MTGGLICQFDQRGNDSLIHAGQGSVQQINRRYLSVMLKNVDDFRLCA